MFVHLTNQCTTSKCLCRYTMGFWRNETSSCSQIGPDPILMPQKPKRNIKSHVTSLFHVSVCVTDVHRLRTVPLTLFLMWKSSSVHTPPVVNLLKLETGSDVVSFSLVWEKLEKTSEFCFQHHVTDIVDNSTLAPEVPPLQHQQRTETRSFTDPRLRLRVSAGRPTLISDVCRTWRTRGDLSEEASAADQQKPPSLSPCLIYIKQRIYHVLSCEGLNESNIDVSKTSLSCERKQDAGSGCVHVTVNNNGEEKSFTKVRLHQMKYAPNYSGGCKELIKWMSLQDTEP